MLFKLTLFTSFTFAVIYPLCFWISLKEPLKNNFHKFHIGLPNVIGGIILVFVLFMDVPWEVKCYVVFWKIVFISVSRYYWKKECPNAMVMTIPSILGAVAFAQVFYALQAKDLLQVCVWMLSGFIFCLSLFAMNLGHWYLNVHGLPIKHLKNVTYVFWFFLILRLIWDLYQFVFGQIFYAGETIFLRQFLFTLDGFLLWIGVFFGTVFPFCCLFFVNEILRLRNTQAATGVLYVILCAVLIGDLTYKYYMLKFGAVL